MWDGNGETTSHTVVECLNQSRYTAWLLKHWNYFQAVAQKHEAGRLEDYSWMSGFLWFVSITFWVETVGCANPLVLPRYLLKYGRLDKTINVAEKSMLVLEMIGLPKTPATAATVKPLYLCVELCIWMLFDLNYSPDGKPPSIHTGSLVPWWTTLTLLQPSTVLQAHAWTQRTSASCGEL